MQFIFEIIIIVMLCFIIDLFTYKYIRYLDKKERAKLAKKETEYLNEMLKKMYPKKETEKKEENTDDWNLLAL